MNTSAWLQELGAIRPMTSVGEVCLVLGEYSEGFYPIVWYQGKKIKEWCEDAGCYGARYECEQWYLFGILTSRSLNREEVERIMRQLK